MYLCYKVTCLCRHHALQNSNNSTLFKGTNLAERIDHLNLENSMLDGKAYNVNRFIPINNYKQMKGNIVENTIIIWSGMTSK
jgi:hypothetical protein